MRPSPSSLSSHLLSPFALLPLLLIMAFAAGCSKPYQRMELFTESEYAPYDRPGTAKIVGQAFIRTHRGDVKYGAGEWVVLNPVTSYSKEWFEVAVLQGETMSPVDPRIGRYQQKELADGEGRFKFSRVAAGSYYIVCPIFWVTQASLYEGLGYSWGEGGVAHAMVTVGEGETAEVVVTRREDASSPAASDSALAAGTPTSTVSVGMRGR